jgi:probable rRNA maturation factor
MPAHAPVKSDIYFHFLRDGFSLSGRTRLKTFIGSVFKKEKKQLGQLSYIFCSDDYLLEINRQYLNHDFFTDIISFDLSGPGPALNAEIYISVDRVRDNARDFKSSFKNELHRVIFHGALHLCGYKDKKRVDQQKMRKMENKYLDLYFKG